MAVNHVATLSQLFVTGPGTQLSISSLHSWYRRRSQDTCACLQRSAQLSTSPDMGPQQGEGRTVQSARLLCQ